MKIRKLFGLLIALLITNNLAVAQEMTPQELSKDITTASHTSVSTVSTGVAGQSLSHKVVYQNGLAPVIVGLAPDGAPIGYRLMLLALVPNDVPDVDERRIRDSVGEIVSQVAKSLRDEIDMQPAVEDPEAVAINPGEDVGKHFVNFAAEVNKRTEASFASAIRQFNQNFGRRFPQYAQSSFLAISLRPCAEPTCSLRDFMARGRDRSTDRFGKLYAWMKSKGGTEVQRAYVLNPQGSFWAVSAKLDTGYEWHANFSQAVLQGALINAAKRARNAQVSLSYSAAELAGLAREATAHISDVFDSAYAAAVELPSNPGAVLAGISDELGRARLTECARLRGTFDATSAGLCAGYSLSDASLATCLSGGACSPAFGTQVNLDSLTLSPKASLTFIAQNAALPRAELGKVEELADLVDECQRSQAADPRYCVIKASLGRNAKTAQTLGCIESVRGHDTTAITECAAAGLSERQKAQVACLQNNRNDYKKLALCAAGDSLSPRSQQLIACASNYEPTDAGYGKTAACFGAATGSPEAKCILENQGDWTSAALCIEGRNVPRPVQSAMRCAETSSSYASFGVCMVSSEGNGEAQRIAQCYAEGQGVPAAVAVCLAGKNLTTDQRIVLECAAQTNGALPATAVCVGGKMATDTLMKCHGHKFGEDGCFGESNELRRFAKALGVPIGPHSVVADVVNIQLRISDVTTRPVLEAGNKLLGDAMKFGTETGLLPDLAHPTWKDAVPGLRPIENFCDHNPCPHIRIDLPHF